MSFIEVSTTVKAPIDMVWKLWTEESHIINWYYATDDWWSPRAKQNLNVGERFLIRMEAKDGSAGFDFSGVYKMIDAKKKILYDLDDGREVSTSFAEESFGIMVTQLFEAENIFPIERQREGWQNILDNFKKYCESYSSKFYVDRKE